MTTDAQEAPAAPAADPTPLRFPSRDDLLALSENSGRRGAEYVDELFKKAIASKLEPGARP